MSNTLPFSQPQEYVVPRRLQDERLDFVLTVLLQEQFPEASFSRGQVVRYITQGLVRVNDILAKPRLKVKLHDRILLAPPVPENDQSQDVSNHLDIESVFENELFLVVNKGPGVQMHRAGSQTRPTLASWAVEHFPSIANVGESSERPGIVHRLDRDTSGLLVLAKTQTAYQALKKAFQTRQVSKTYIALVYGHMADLAGEITAPLTRTSGELRRRAIDPEHFRGVLPGTVRDAQTLYRVIARYEDYDLAELTPKTGRTHQLRVHMAYLGHPIVGDRLYGFKGIKRQKKLWPKRQLLHAATLSFPLADQSYSFHVPLPEDFRTILQAIDGTRDPSYDGEALKSLF